MNTSTLFAGLVGGLTALLARSAAAALGTLAVRIRGRLGRLDPRSAPARPPVAPPPAPGGRGPTRPARASLGQAADDAETVPMLVSRTMALSPSSVLGETVVDLATGATTRHHGPAPTPAAVEVSRSPSARFRTRLDAQLLCVPDGGVWLASHVGGKARCRLGGVGVDLAALPITTHAAGLDVRSGDEVETIDLREFAAPGTDAPVSIQAMGAARGPSHVLVAGTAAGVATLLVAPPAGDGDHQLELLQWFADRFGRFWSVEDLGSHAAQALSLLVRDQVTRDVEFALVGVRGSELAVTMTPGLAVVGDHRATGPTDGLVTTLLSSGAPAEVGLIADPSAWMVVDRGTVAMAD